MQKLQDLNVIKSPNENIKKTIPIYVLLFVSCSILILSLIYVGNTFLYLLKYGVKEMEVNEFYSFFLRLMMLSLSGLTIWVIFSRRKYGLDICAFYIFFLGLLPISLNSLSITPHQTDENIKQGFSIIVLFAFCIMAAAFYKSERSKSYFHRENHL